MASAVVIGGGPAGLSTAMLLSRAGVDVTVLEKDAASPPSSSDEAWDRWQRNGVAQFRQPHTLLPGGFQILTEHFPEVASTLEQLGAHRYDMLEALPPWIEDRSPRQGDENLRSLGARRPTYELAFALSAAAAGLEVRRGVGVTELTRGPSVFDSAPHVTGVRTSGGEECRADVVIDAGGRRSQLPALLEKLGARPLHEESVDSKFAYYTRYYQRSDSGDFPRPYVISLLPAGSISILTLPCDNGVWSTTLFTTTSDKAMRAVRDPAVFEKVVRAHPARAQWVEGEPLSEVKVMAGIADRKRSVFDQAGPVATGVVPIGDAWACTNPSLGRGLTMALMQIVDVVPALLQALDDSADVPDAWRAKTKERAEIWHDATFAEDRARNAEMDAIRDGSEPNTPEDPVFKAMLVDPDVFRARLRVGTLIEHPDTAFSHPKIREKIAAVADEEPDLPEAPVPSRAELETLLR